VKDDEVKTAAAALQIQVHRDFAPVWAVDAEIVFVKKDSIPPAGSWLLAILDETGVPGASLTWRNLTPHNLPAARVF